MKETRRLEVRTRVFEKADILRLGAILAQQHAAAREAKRHSSVAFQFNCADGTTYESEQLGPVEEDTLFESKRILSLDFTFHDYEINRYINIALAHGTLYAARQGIVVTGQDHDWVNGSFATLKEIVDSAKPQDNYVLRHKTLFLHLCALGTGVVAYTFGSTVWGFVIRDWHPSQPSGALLTFLSYITSYPWMLDVLNWFMMWLTGMLCAHDLRRWVFSLWPDIEFDFGPEHLRLEKARRTRLNAVVLAVVIPLMLRILYDSARYVAGWSL